MRKKRLVISCVLGAVIGIGCWFYFASRGRKVIGEKVMISSELPQEKSILSPRTKMIKAEGAMQEVVVAGNLRKEPLVSIGDDLHLTYALCRKIGLKDEESLLLQKELENMWKEMRELIKQHIKVDMVRQEDGVNAFQIKPFEGGDAILEAFRKKVAIGIGEEKASAFEECLDWQRYFGNFGQNTILIHFKDYEGVEMFATVQEVKSNIDVENHRELRPEDVLRKTTLPWLQFQNLYGVDLEIENNVEEDEGNG